MERHRSSRETAGGRVGRVVVRGEFGPLLEAALPECSGRSVTPLQAYRVAWEKRRALVGATAWQFFISALLVLTVIGIPYGIYRFVRTSLFVQAIMLQDRSARESMAASAELTYRRWWWTFGFTALVDILTILTVPGGAGTTFRWQSGVERYRIVNVIVLALRLPAPSYATTRS
jgi:hypothetical protein